MKRKTNQIFSFLLVLVMALGLFPGRIVAVAADEETDAAMERQGEHAAAETDAAQTEESDGSDAPAFIVTFDANGHGTAPQAVTVNEGETITEPADPTEDGYTFTGWYEDKDATDAWDFATNTVSDDTTLYAGWTENTQRALRNAPALRNGNTDTHSVTVTHNGYGSAEASPDSATEGTTITLTATPQSGYSLDYWEVLSGGVTVTNNTFEMGTEDVEVKAIFKQDPTNHFIKINTALRNLKFGKPVTLTLSEVGLSNGAITWTSSDSSILSISGSEATFHGTGTVTLTVTQAADGAYPAATDSLEVTVGKGDASSIDWPTLGPVYYKMSLVDIPISGGSTGWGTFSMDATSGQIEHTLPGKSSSWKVKFTPKAELSSYFETSIIQWISYTVMARDTLDSCISVAPSTIDFGSWEQSELNQVPEIFVDVLNRTDLATPAFVDITANSNSCFRVRNATATGGSTASPGSNIRFGITPKTTLTPGTYEVPITFTCATSDEAIEKSLTAKITVKEILPEATAVTLSPGSLTFDVMEGYDSDAVAQTVTVTNTSAGNIEITDVQCLKAHYQYDIEPVSSSSMIPAGGTAQFRIKPKSGYKYPGYNVYHNTDIRFTIKDSGGNMSAKTVRAKMEVREFMDYFSGLSITPDTVDFGTKTAGYQLPEEKTLAFNLDAGRLVTIKADEYPRSNNYNIRMWQNGLQFVHSECVVSSVTNTKMTIAPKQGLPPGNYDETIEVNFYDSAGNKMTKSFHLKFTVEKPDATVTATGDGNGTASASPSTAKDGTIVSLSATPNDSYLFSHWEVISGGVTLDDANSQMTAFKIGKDDVSVKAHFTAIPTGEYRISVVTDGHGSASSDPKSGTTGDDVNLSAKAAEGYYFVRWEVVSGGVQIADATNPKPQRAAFKIGDSDVEIKAVFAKNPYQVTVTVEGLGTAEATPDSGRAGDTVSLTATPREYYRFKEWRIASGSGTIADKTSATTTFTFANESAKVEAVFEAIPYGVDIDYVGKGTVEELPGTYNDEFMLTAIPADGYKFYKWEVLDHSTGVITAVGTTNKAFIAVKCHAERIKLQVTFVAIPYSISYTLNEGTNASGNPDTYTVEDTIVLAEPTRDGYTFDGWYDGSGKKMTTIPAGTTGNLTLEARWQPTVYNITYNLNGGSNDPGNPTTYTVETNTITLEDASHSDFVFDGWYDASGKKWTTIPKGTTGDLTLEAQWKKKPAPNITFPRAQSITYGQTLADSRLTGGSTEYGTFAWEKPSTVPAAGTGLFYVIFTPYPETEQYYEPIPEAVKRQLVDVTMHKQTPALTLTATKGVNAATLTATLTTAGQGDAPTRTVMFEYSADNGLTWTTVPSGDAVALASGTGTATHVWNYPYSDREYQLRATYSGDFNYETANGNTTFDPGKQNQDGFEVKVSSEQVTYGEALTFTIANEKGTGAVTYDVSDTSVMTVDANGNATILKYGIVTVTATKAGDNDYNTASAAISVTVKKAKLTFSAEDKTVKQGDPMPTLTFVTTGLVNGDTVSTDPVLKTSAADTNTAGAFDIQISGGAVTTKGGALWTDCYEAFHVKGKLTVNTPVIVTGIKLNSDNAKKEYTEGEALDVTGLTLEVSKSDGSKETVDVTASMVNGFDSSKLGKQTLTVTYESFDATYKIEVKAKVAVSYAAKDSSGNTIQSVTWQKGSGKNLDLTFKRSEDDHLTYGLFGSLEIGGVTVGSANYSAAEGSLKLSIKPEYLESLSVGDHTVKVNFQDGSATVKLTVKTSGDPNIPRTADESHLALWSSLMFLSVAAMILLLLYTRKRKTEK